jgi:hypothetical protein
MKAKGIAKDVRNTLPIPNQNDRKNNMALRLFKWVMQNRAFLILDRSLWQNIEGFDNPLHFF